MSKHMWQVLTFLGCITTIGIVVYYLIGFALVILWMD